jgi:chloramphenicol O-acetyltransferase type A
MNRRIIDMKTNPRRGQFEHFIAMHDPYMGVTRQVDITAFLERMQREKTPFFLTFSYEVLQAANFVPEFRRRILEDGQVVEYDVCRGSCTVAKEDETYSYCTLDGTLPFDEFLRIGKADLEDAKEQGTMEEDADVLELFFISCVPWFSYTGTIEPHENPSGSNVSFIWGKYETENGKTKIPFTAMANHALVDGFHLGKFFQELDRRLAL